MGIEHIKERHAVQGPGGSDQDDRVQEHRLGERLPAEQRDQLVFDRLARKACGESAQRNEREKEFVGEVVVNPAWARWTAQHFVGPKGRNLGFKPYDAALGCADRNPQYGHREAGKEDQLGRPLPKGRKKKVHVRNELVSASNVK